MEELAALRALADETRLSIVRLLLRRNYCLRALAEALTLTPGAVSQHVKVLREAGLLEATRQGYFMHYEVNRGALRSLSARLTELADTLREEPPAAEHEACRRQGRCGEDVGAACRRGPGGPAGPCGRGGR
ncbi:MAG TPA: metalloregulator ArsR/SmtB family transcription factor [Candidatus Acidoferrum sp.]|nr:metalloregulator ArsR/SmtB family transcription factor [Candidatus Acidoferrum sp.]